MSLLHHAEQAIWRKRGQSATASSPARPWHISTPAMRGAQPHPLPLRHSREISRVCSRRVNRPNGAGDDNALPICGLWAMVRCRGWATLSKHKWSSFGERRGASTRSSLSAIDVPLPERRGAREIEDHHCCAEFFAENHGWVPMNASEAAKAPVKRDIPPAPTTGIATNNPRFIPTTYYGAVTSQSVSLSLRVDALHA